jgi:hypothetical protein
MNTRAPKIKSLQEAYGNWLNTINWTHFVTLTSYYPLKPYAARMKMQRFGEYLRYILKDDFNLFWVVEQCYDKGGVHIHALLRINNPPIAPKSLIVHAWHKEAKPAGYGKHNLVHIQDYDPSKGGNYYVVKYIGNPDADHDIL